METPGPTQDGFLDEAASAAAPDEPPLTQPTNIRRFKPKSFNFPDLMSCPTIWAFLHQFIKDFKHHKWQDCTSNLSTRSRLIS